ncbi:MAG: cysteine desulfurase [Phenylobacterium sp.]|jgi:cysteine desulfurase
MSSAKNDVYLDNNATTRVLPQVAEAVTHAMLSCYANPSSSHIAGIKAKHILESTRSLAREVIGAASGEIIFTSGATEGIQMGIVSALLTIQKQAKTNGTSCQDGYLLYGATEHKAVPNTLKHWNEALGINAQIVAIPVDSNGLLDEHFISEHIGQSLIICTMAVNNETGVQQDLAKLEQVIRRDNNEVLWLVDCVQALGKMNLHISETSIDYAPFSGHKVYTPKGIGFIYIRDGAPCIPFIAGGGQESGARSGTENIPGIAALKKVFELLLDDEDQTIKSASQLHAYRNQLADTLREVFPAVKFNHDFAYSVPTTLNFSVPGLFSKDLMDLFDAASIRVSSGSACSAKVTRSFVLDAMGAETWRSESAIRMSFGPASTQQEIDEACAAITSIIPALKHSCLIMSDVHGIGEGQLKTGFAQLQYDGCYCWLYIDIDSKECVIVDPLPQLADRIESWITCQKLSVKAVIDTHAHNDHDAYQGIFRDIVAGHIPAALRNTDGNGWPLNVQGQLTVANTDLPYVQVGSFKVARIQTPGHTDDCLSLLFIDETDHIVLALLGDMIMPGGFGRTDISSGDPHAFYQSLKTLLQILPSDTLLGSGHDYQHKLVTTLACEFKDNALLAKVADDTISATAFEIEKKSIDLQLSGQGGGFLCGQVQVQAVDEPYSLRGDEIESFLAQRSQAVVVDVREACEYEMGDIKDELNFKGDFANSVLNVPLTRFADFVISAQEYKNTPLLLICRTGTRSLLACQSLLRLGFCEVYNIKGGLALN